MDRRVELVDAAYRLDLDEVEQLQLFADVVRHRFEPRRRVVALSARIGDGQPTYRAAAVDPQELDPIFKLSLPAADAERMYLSEPAPRSSSTFIGADYRAGIARHGVREFAGLNCPTHTGINIVVGAVYDEPKTVTAHEHAYWAPVAEHIAAGARLREQAMLAVDAVFRVDHGQLVTEHLTDATTTPSAHIALRQAVLRREQVRTRSPAAREELWPGLISGQWTLIDRFEENGRRYLLAVRNPAGPQVHALTPRERRVIAALSRGESNKATSIELGLSEATISRLATRALAKLGVGISDLLAAVNAPATALQLGRVRLGLVTLPGDFPGMRELTSAERAAVRGVLRGLTTATIARERGVATRTVTNQLASAFQKLGVRSRRELILALCRPT